MESLPSTAERPIQPAPAITRSPGGPAEAAAGRHELIANALLGGLLLSAFLMAAGAAAKRYGPTLDRKSVV